MVICTDRQASQQAGSQTDRQAERQSTRLSTNRKAARQSIKTGRQADKHHHTQTERQAGRMGSTQDQLSVAVREQKVKHSALSLRAGGNHQSSSQQAANSRVLCLV